MKKLKKPILFACALIVALISAVCALFGGTGKVYAYPYSTDPYYHEFEKYHITYDIRSDRTMDVSIDFSVSYIGSKCTGLLYDIPVNAGDRVKNIKAYLLNGENGEEGHLDYKITNEEQDLITVDMDDYTSKTGRTRHYRLTYEYAITKVTSGEENTLFLNAVGGGFNPMHDVKITINLPDGAIKEDITCSDYSPKDFDVSGNTVTLSFESNPKFNAVTFTLPFEEGVLTVKHDITPYYVIIAACVILAILFALKFLCFNKDGLTPVVNVEAPDDMDPLTMGKLIDNRVDKSDVTSLIYYWANKGYIKINMDNQNDIELIRIYKSLPPQAPKYQKIMYEGLFKKGDAVKINSLTNSFYTTVEAVTRSVNAESGKLYDGKSMGVAVLFALLGALLAAVTPIVMSLINLTIFSIAPLFMIVPAFIVFALTQSVRYNRLKLSKGKMALMYLGIAALSAVFVAAYAFFLPSYVIEVVPKIILGAACFAIVMLSTMLISRTQPYTQKLNKIIGFRDFIKYAEKDKLEAMLEQNPEFYYQVLPYAIVLGVSDIWENKFAALTVTPPSWVVGRRNDAIFNFVVFNAAIRTVNSSMTTAFISRPSSGSFSGGGSHGGSFGGFSGGGHGGGGARGR